jgi:nitrilase
MAGMPERKAENLDRLEHLVRRAAAEGAQVILGPEVVTTGFVGGETERRLAEPIPGPTTERMADLASELGVYLLFGMSEIAGGQVYNAVPVLTPQGMLMGVMRKVHINRYETGAGWRNGSSFPVWRFETPTGALTAGVMVCYDREVPESARLLMLQGADLILNPLACTCPTDDIHRCLLRTRAFENEVYLFMVNHAAPRLNGHSMAFDLNGDIVSELDEDEGILLYTADIDRLIAYREQGIYGLHHRRPELYAPLCDPSGQQHPTDANLPPSSAASPD